MKRNMPSELGWGIGTEGGWSQHSSTPGSGSWTSTANQDSTSSWQVMNKSDSVSDPGDDASSGKSGATSTSVSNVTSQPQDTTSTSNTGLLQTGSGNSWSPSNPTSSRQLDSGPWGSSSSPAPSGIGTIGWSSNPPSTSVSSSNQGHNSNVQPGSSIGSSVGTAGWQGNSITNTSTLPPSMSSGMQSNPLSSQWQGSTMLGDIGDFSKSSDPGWNNPSPCLLGNSKDLGGGSNSDPRMWGLSSDKTGDSQWDVPKTQWGNSTLATVSDQGTSSTEMSFAQATLKGLKLPPAANVSQAALSSNHEEILRAVENHEGWGSRPIRQDTSWDVETSPKSMRKFSSDGSAGVAAWNNSNGTTNWKNIRENPSSGSDGGVGVPGVNSWNADKDQSSWGGQPKTSMDPNAWNVGNNVDPKTFGTWAGAGGAGDASNKMWGQKPEACSWGDRSGAQRTPSISSWGEDGDTGAWDDQRRMASGMVGMQVMVPPSPGMNVPTGIARMIPQGMPGVNMAAINSDATPWNDGQKPGWNPANSAAIARTNMDEPWNKPPPTRSGWGDSAHEGVEVDNGTTLWTENVSKQSKAMNWGDALKPKVPAGWDEASWALAHRAKLQMPQKFVSSGSNPPTQMRAKLLQHLMDMGFRKEDAQNALITNNMNIDLALNDLKSGTVNVPRKDLDVDIFQANGTQARMPYMSKGLGGDDMLDIRPDQVPPFHNMQNTPFPNAQMSNQPFMPSNASMPPSSLNLNPSSINSGLQQKLMQQQQQVPPSATMGQRVPMPPIASGVNSQVPQQQQIRAQLRQAVNNGFISPQLLNYQLPHNILVLLHQLLQLQSAHQTAMSTQQQIMQQTRASGNRSNPQIEQMVGIISNINQQILNVQKQLQQAQNTLFSTQKPLTLAQPSPGTVTPQAGVHIGDSLDALTTDLANVALQSQSRLATQWKPASDASSATTSDITGTSTTPTTMKAIDENGGKAVLQSSSPNMNLIPGGLGMTGDKTWSSNMSTTSSSNWPMSADSSGTNSQIDSKSSNSTRLTTSLLSGLSSGTDVIPEFVPGKPWQGLTKNVEDDPHVTPGSIQLQRSLSVNRVHDDSLNHLDGYKLGSSSWGTSLKTDNNLGLSQLGNHPPPGMGLAKGAGPQQWSSASVNRQTSWPHSSNSAFTKVAGSGWNDNNVAPSAWIILKNLTVDPSTAHALSAQHGTLVSFYPLAQGQLALVQYSNRKIAYVAQQRLNNFQMGLSVIAADFINEADAQRVIAQIPPPQPNTMPMMNASPWSQAPPFTPFQNTGVRGGDPWSTSMPATQQLNSKYGSGGENPWGLWDRSDYNPNLLSNFLGGESM